MRTIPGEPLSVLPEPETGQVDRRTLLQQAMAVFATTLSGCVAKGSDTGSGAVTTPSARTSAADRCAASMAPATPVAGTRTGFVHPGLLNTAESLERMRAGVAAARQPWHAGWAVLSADPYSSLDATPRPVEEVSRPGNFRQMFSDMQRAYVFAIAWQVTGDVRYADRAVLFLDSWSSVMQRLTGNSDRFLASGIYGYQWACAAEIMRTYPGWSPAGIKAFQHLLRTVFYPMCNEFLVNHNGANITNYWANWDLVNIAGIMAIGVFCDDVALYDEAKTYFLGGRGNGALAHMVYRLFPGHMGQFQESGRDQGHCTLGVTVLAAICEMAWSQGDDLYGAWNNRVLSGAEYVAATNLRDADGAFLPLPFSRYSNRHGTATAISDAGRPHSRPAWEGIYNHYVNRRGLSAPHVARMAARLRPEVRDGSADGPGMGTLLYSLPPIARGAAPSGVTARVVGGAVAVDWWGSAHATGYVVERSASACGPFAALATVDERRTYTDTPPAGTWHYRITATGGGADRSSIPVRVAFPGELWFHLPLDEGGGTTVRDATRRFGASTLAGGVRWGAGRNGGRAPLLDGGSGHILLPDGVMAALADCTVAIWVNADPGLARDTWLFSVGGSDLTYYAIRARDGAGRLRGTVSRTTYFGQQGPIADTSLATGAWVHVALTLIDRTMTLYVDGVEVGSNAEVDIAPYQMGHALQNRIGRSPYPADPYFHGQVQDLRIYSRGLRAAEVAALRAG